jgi:hypothetical protein
MVGREDECIQHFGGKARRIMLKMDLRKVRARGETEFMWLRIGSIGRLL